MKNCIHRLTFASGATLLAAAAAFAQPVTDENRAPKLPNNAAAAALFKDVKTAGETMPDPNRPAGGNTNTIHPIQNFVPVTDAVLHNPDPNDWIMMRGNYQDWGFSQLDQINRGNIKTLQLVWARLMDPAQNEAAPIVYKGVMFLPNPNDVIQAIDAASGEILWQYRRRLPSQEQFHNSVWGVVKRSLALYDDKIYFISRDNYVVALDARTGKELWQVNRGGDYYATNTTGPIVVGGMVIAGAQCQEAPFACWVDAHDAATGKLLWHNELIPHPGEPGDETWGGKPFNERWITDVWGALTYDPEANLVYYGSSAVGPASEAQRGQIGATMTGTDTRWAVDPKTGKIVWRHQVMNEDNWDQDCTFEMLPITTPVHPDPQANGVFSVGRNVASASRKTLTGIPCKTGIMWSLDALTGQYLWSKSTVAQNLVTKIDDTGKVTINADLTWRDVNKTIHMCPTFNGGRNWPMSAYSPQTNVMYVQLQNTCADMSIYTDNIPSLPRNQYNVASVSTTVAPGRTGIGRVDAISVETGKTLWSWETPVTNKTSILVTAGGLLFEGGQDRYFRAHNQADGKVIWQVRLGSAVMGSPATFSVKRRQYIAITGGGGAVGANLLPGLDQPTGANMVYVFALPE